MLGTPLKGLCGRSKATDRPSPAHCGAVGFGARRKNVTSLQECASRCLACGDDNCRFAVFSKLVKGGDCTLFVSCDASRLFEHRDYQTLEVTQTAIQPPPLASRRAVDDGRSEEAPFACMAWQQKNGVWLKPIVPYKAGSTQFLTLLVFVATGRRPNPHHPRNWLLLLHDREVPHQLPEDMMPGEPLVRVLFTRSPYERMLSVYLDKLVEPKGRSLHILPHGLHENSTFSAFVRAVVAERRPRSILGAKHYGPITKHWRPSTCVRSCTTHLGRSSSSTSSNLFHGLC